MKKSLIITFLLFALVETAYSQRPKLVIKAFAGTNTSTFVYRLDSTNADVLTGWQTGIGLRVSKRMYFGEIDFVYKDYAFTLEPGDDLDDGIGITEPLKLAMHSLEIPMTAGIIPIKEPLYKLFLYGGFVNKFALKGRFSIGDETIKVRPSEIEQPFYGFDVRVGSQLDLAIFNFDFSYSFGITNALKERVRTNLHAINFNVGLIF
jgi:hypothetical protein